MDRAVADGSEAAVGTEPSLADHYARIQREAACIAGGADGFYRRREALRAIEAECGSNTVFPVIALREQSAFVSFYADYHFTRRYGQEPGAARFVDAALFCLFNRLHQAVANGEVLSDCVRRALFTTACAVYGGDDIASAAG